MTTVALRPMSRTLSRRPTRDPAGSRSRQNTLRFVGAYYLATGLWPLLWYRSFEWATGKKQDDWLVKTFGLVLAAFGAATLASSRHDQPPVLPVVAVTSAIAVAEAWYAMHGRIRRIYLADAAVEASVAIRSIRRYRAGRSHVHPHDRSSVNRLVQSIRRL